MGNLFVNLFTVYPMNVTISFADYCCEHTIFIQDRRIYIVYFLCNSVVILQYISRKNDDMFSVIEDTHLMCKMNYKSRRSSY